MCMYAHTERLWHVRLTWHYLYIQFEACMFNSTYLEIGWQKGSQTVPFEAASTFIQNSTTPPPPKPNKAKRKVIIRVHLRRLTMYHNTNESTWTRCVAFTENVHGYGLRDETHIRYLVIQADVLGGLSNLNY